jgi:hypothetical protein
MAPAITTTTPPRTISVASTVSVASTTTVSTDSAASRVVAEAPGGALEFAVGGQPFFADVSSTYVTLAMHTVGGMVGGWMGGWDGWVR